MPSSVGRTTWAAATGSPRCRGNKANGDHMAEEEREGLTDFRR